MAQQISDHQNNKVTLDKARADLMRTTWKHYAVSAAIVSGAVFGVAESSKLIMEAQSHSPSQPVDGGKMSLAALWLTLTTIGGLAGGAVMLPKLARDQRRLDRLTALENAGETHVRILGKKSIYQKEEDGRYETIGAGHARVQKRMRMEFAGAAGLAVTGTLMVLDTVFSDRLMLTSSMLPLVKDVASAQNLAAIAEGFTGVAALGAAIAEAVAGHAHSKVANEMADDKRHYGANARWTKKVKVEENVKSGVQPS